MADIRRWVEDARQEGYSAVYAAAKVCQDIILKAIAASGFSRSITIKGGVIMRSMTGNTRRATRDLDLDFIRYSLEEVMKIDAAYTYALVGSGGAEYLWILSRTKVLPDAAKRELLDEAKRRGYDTGKLIWVRQE